jgi:AbrB family looped-hinge helix DNA binding protein
MNRRTDSLTTCKEIAVSKIAVSRITSKGQITIPEVIRREYGLQAGEQIEWEVIDGGVLAVRRTGQSLEHLSQILPKPKRARTIEEMDQAVGEHLAEKHRVRR